MITTIFARKTFTPIIAGMLFALAANTANATDDDYLRTLKAEANGRSAPQQVAVNEQYLDALSVEAEASAKIGKGQKRSNDEDRLEMEALLEEEKPTSFKYYKKLNAKDKAKLATMYSADTSDKKTKLDNLRHKILDLYFKR